MKNLFKVKNGDCKLIAKESYIVGKTLELWYCDGFNSVLVVAETEEEALRAAEFYGKGELELGNTTFNGVEITAIDCRDAMCFFTDDIVEKAREKYKAFYGKDSVPKQFNVAYSKSKGWSCQFCECAGEWSSGFTTCFSGEDAVKVWNGSLNVRTELYWDDNFSDE